MKQAPFMALVTLFAVSLQLNGMLMMWKLHQAKQLKIMPTEGPFCEEFFMSSSRYPDWAELFILPARPPIHIHNFMKDLEVRQDLENQPSLVNWAHVKRP